VYLAARLPAIDWNDFIVLSRAEPVELFKIKNYTAFFTFLMRNISKLKNPTERNKPIEVDEKGMRRLIAPSDLV
jgi:hypothetical protein